MSLPWWDSFPITLTFNAVRPFDFLLVLIATFRLRFQWPRDILPFWGHAGIYSGDCGAMSAKEGDKMSKKPTKPTKTEAGASRRELFQIGNALLLPALMGGSRVLAAGPLKAGPDIYQSIGVEPVINCRGTFTIIGASIELPEVRAAMDAAAQHFVQLDELADAVGRRLGELTGAEWGMVSAGCAAGLKHVTAACVAGGNPEKLLRIPNLQGLDKTEVVSPRSSRSVYDHAIRNIGVKMITVETAEEFERALSPHTAMVYLSAGRATIEGPLSLVNV